jgi:hypothetical protein
MPDSEAIIPNLPADCVPADALARKPHKKGCRGDLYRLPTMVTVDRLGRKGNGGWVAHEYVCNMRWDGCKARILLTERAVRRLAVAAHIDGSKEAT